MDVAITCVVPDMLCHDVHGVGVACSFVVCKSMGAVISSAANVTAYQADPEVLCGAADGAFVVGSVPVEGAMCEGVVLRVAADGTA